MLPVSYTAARQQCSDVYLNNNDIVYKRKLLAACPTTHAVSSPSMSGYIWNMPRQSDTSVNKGWLW